MVAPSTPEVQTFIWDQVVDLPSPHANNLNVLILGALSETRFLLYWENGSDFDDYSRYVAVCTFDNTGFTLGDPEFLYSNPLPSDPGVFGVAVPFWSNDTGVITLYSEYGPTTHSGFVFRLTADVLDVSYQDLDFLYAPPYFTFAGPDPLFNQMIPSGPGTQIVVQTLGDVSDPTQYYTFVLSDDLSTVQWSYEFQAVDTEGELFAFPREDILLLGRTVTGDPYIQTWGTGGPMDQQPLDHSFNIPTYRLMQVCQACGEGGAAFLYNPGFDSPLWRRISVSVGGALTWSSPEFPIPDWVDPDPYDIPFWKSWDGQIFMSPVIVDGDLIRPHWLNPAMETFAVGQPVVWETQFPVAAVGYDYSFDLIFAGIYTIHAWSTSGFVDLSIRQRQQSRSIVRADLQPAHDRQRQRQNNP